MKRPRRLSLGLISVSLVMLASSLAWGNGFTLERLLSSPFPSDLIASRNGDKVAWVSLPGEIFVELGLDIKRTSPFACTMIAELANGSIGYIPNKAAYAEGNYEVVSARCAVGSGEKLVAAADKLLKELQKK